MGKDLWSTREHKAYETLPGLSLECQQVGDSYNQSGESKLDKIQVISGFIWDLMQAFERFILDYQFVSIFVTSDQGI